MQLVNLRRIRAWHVEERLIGDVKPSYASSTRRAIPKGGREAFLYKNRCDVARKKGVIMKLYFYYLGSDNEVKKEVETCVRENKRQYIIPPRGKSRLSGLYEWKLSKECCEKIQVDDSLYKWSPYIVSAHGDLDSIPRLAEMLKTVSESCVAVNEQIKGIVENE